MLGDGTQENPFQITNYTELVTALGTSGAYCKLMNDINVYKDYGYVNKTKTTMDYAIVVNAYELDMNYHFLIDCRDNSEYYGLTLFRIATKEPMFVCKNGAITGFDVKNNYGIVSGYAIMRNMILVISSRTFTRANTISTFTMANCNLENSVVIYCGKVHATTSYNNTQYVNSSILICPDMELANGSGSGGNVVVQHCMISDSLIVSKAKFIGKTSSDTAASWSDKSSNYLYLGSGGATANAVKGTICHFSVNKDYWFGNKISNQIGGSSNSVRNLVVSNDDDMTLTSAWSKVDKSQLIDSDLLTDKGFTVYVDNIPDDALDSDWCIITGCNYPKPVGVVRFLRALTAVRNDWKKYCVSGALSHCENLKAVRIPDTLREIGKYSFTYTSLKDVVLPDECTYWATSFPKGCKVKGGKLLTDDIDDIREILKC